MISTRPATASDFEFTYAAKKSGYGVHVKKLWGKWDENWQREEHRKDLSTGRLSIIRMNGQDVGYLFSTETAECLNLADICIIPEYQGKGIGTSIISGLIKEAGGRKIPFQLGVFKNNKAAIKLYRALGLKETSETRTHIIMRITPAKTY